MVFLSVFLALGFGGVAFVSFETKATLSFLFFALTSLATVLLSAQPERTLKNDGRGEIRNRGAEARYIFPWSVISPPGASKVPAYLLGLYSGFVFMKLTFFSPDCPHVPTVIGTWAAILSVSLCLHTILSLTDDSTRAVTEGLQSFVQTIGMLTLAMRLGFVVGDTNDIQPRDSLFFLLDRIPTNSLLVVFHVFMSAYCAQRTIRSMFKNLRPVMSTFLILFHILAIVGLSKVFLYEPSTPQSPSKQRLILEILALYQLGGLGITAGAHRLWAHKSYKACWVYRFVIMIFNSLANQGNIYHWSRDHRVHHRYSEKEPDPHNASKGFFYAHMGWLLLKKPEVVREAGRRIDCSDLLADSVVVLQKTLDPWWNAMWCFIIPSLYGRYMYGSFWFGFFTFGALRWIITLHATWCVNSVAHLWGPRPYNDKIGPVESFFTAIVAAGEGWHNWHHQYGYDYATSEFGALRQYNPTKVIIDIAALFGLVWDRKRATKMWQLAKKKQAQKHAASLEALRQSSMTTTPTSISAPPLKEESEEEATSSLSALSSIDTLVRLIPSKCYRISFTKSSLYLFRDLLIMSLVSILAGWLWLRLSSSYLDWCSPLHEMYSSLVGLGLHGLLFSLYAVAQGTVLVAVWVAAYEASGQRFAKSRWLNVFIGVVLSTILLIPYTQRKKEREEKETTKEEANRPSAAHLCRALHEDVFSVFNISRWTHCGNTWRLPTGGMAMGVGLAVLGSCVRSFGGRAVLSWYLFPWFIMNMWLLLYHHLLVVKVHQAFHSLRSPSSGSINSTPQLDSSLSNDRTNTPVEELLKDQAAEDDYNNLPECAYFFDPHSISQIQKDARVLSTPSLQPSTVEFYTYEWLMSAMHLFDGWMMSSKVVDDADVAQTNEVVRSSRDNNTTLLSGLWGVMLTSRLYVSAVIWRFVGSLHHHLPQVSILQSLDLSVPHYHVKEAVKALRGYVAASHALAHKAKIQTVGSGGKSGSSPPSPPPSSSQAVFRAVSQTARLTQRLVVT